MWDRLRQAVKIQFRDTVEFHVRQRIIFTATDSRGHVRKNVRTEGDSTLQGYDPHKTKMLVAETTLTPSHLFSLLVRGRWKLFINGNLWITIPVQMILGVRGNHYDLTTEQAEDPESIAVRMSFPWTCPAFAMTRPQYYLPDMFCGTSRFRFAARDLALQSFTFESGGLPVRIKVKPWNECMLQRYYAEIEYHKIMLPNSDDPYVVPKRVINVLETDKGKIQIVSIYEPNEPPGSYVGTLPNQLATARH